MRYLVAVSGGIDSVVLLDTLVRDGRHEIFIAHFDHGIRTDSAEDARFVEALAAQYNLPITVRREELGAGASEEVARDRRYAFLRYEAEKQRAVIATAHHADDVVETVAINLTRGTGWRGLAVFDGRYVARPLLHMTKADIRQYATEKRLEWVEDSTNSETIYLRNRMRRKIAIQLSSSSKRDVLALREAQVTLKGTIDELVQDYVREDHTYERYFFIMLDQTVALEVLRAVFIHAHSVGPTRPQLERALLAIKTARPGSMREVGDGVSIRFLARVFLVETP